MTSSQSLQIVGSTTQHVLRLHISTLQYIYNGQVSTYLREWLMVRLLHFHFAINIQTD